MINIKSPGAYTVAGLLSAFAASFCCITPVIALLAGSSSIASNFSWIDPVRPYLIGLTIAILAFAWYGKLEAARTNDMDCNCETTPTTPFLQSKSFLGIMTVLAMLMLTFPLYTKTFYPKPKAEVAKTLEAITKLQAIFIIQGMTCEGCEAHVNNELSKVAGVLTHKTSYSSGNSLVTFDSSKVNLKTVEAAIHKTGYKVTKSRVVNSSNTAVTSKEIKLR